MCTVKHQYWLFPFPQTENPLLTLLDGLERSDTSQASVAQQYIEPGKATSEQDPQVPTFLLWTIMTARVLSIISCTGNRPHVGDTTQGQLEASSGFPLCRHNGHCQPVALTRALVTKEQRRISNYRFFSSFQLTFYIYIHTHTTSSTLRCKTQMQ